MRSWSFAKLAQVIVARYPSSKMPLLGVSLLVAVLGMTLIGSALNTMLAGHDSNAQANILIGGFVLPMLGAYFADGFRRVG